MEITFTSSADMLLKLDYPKDFSSVQYLDERDTAAVMGPGTLKFKECWFDGACLLCTEFDVTQPCTLHLQCNSFCWLMNFMLEGELNSGTGSIPIQLQQGRYHTFYCPVLNMDIKVEQRAKVFTICLTHRFIYKLLGKHLLPEQFEGGNAEELTLVTQDEYLNSRFAILLNEIVKANQPPYIRRIYLEAKILELLSLQLEGLENKQLVKEVLSSGDVARLNQARDIVQQNLQTPCSLIELARKTGLNDYKLKRGFKALFGHTVFGYLSEIRMETAYRHLKDGRSVNEVAETVGYKNAHHFTAAFKKRFGLLPSQVIK